MLRRVSQLVCLKSTCVNNLRTNSQTSFYSTMSDTLVVASNKRRARAFSPNSTDRLQSKMAASTSTKESLSKLSTEGKLCTVGCLSTTGETPFCAPRHHEDVQDQAEADRIAVNAILQRLQSKVIEVEGNIGCGKSTLTNNLFKFCIQESNNEEFAVVHSEKVNNTFLSSFYRSPKEYAFAFQMYMLTTRIFQMDEAYRQAEKENKVAFLDRGAVGDVLFALQNYNNGNITAGDMDIYKSVCTERFPSSLSQKVNAVLYLDVAPEVCWYRMTTVRQREAENGVPPAYLNGIDEVYFHLLIDWLSARKGGFYDMNIGEAPPMLIVRWHNFGCTRTVLEKLDALLEGKLKSPTVEHCLTLSRDYQLVVDTAEDVERLAQSLKTNDYLLVNGVNTTDIAMNWDLQHTDAFRRIAMYVLSEQGHVSFYGASTAQLTPKFNEPRQM